MLEVEATAETCRPRVLRGVSVRASGPGRRGAAEGTLQPCAPRSLPPGDAPPPLRTPLSSCGHARASREGQRKPGKGVPGSRGLCRRGSAGSERSLLGEPRPAARASLSSFRSTGGADTVMRASRRFSPLPENTFVATRNKTRVVLKTPGERTSLVPTPARHSGDRQVAATAPPGGGGGGQSHGGGTCGSHRMRQ